MFTEIITRNSRTQTESYLISGIPVSVFLPPVSPAPVSLAADEPGQSGMDTLGVRDAKH